MNDVEKHAWCKDAFKNKSGELWLFLDSNKKVVNGDDVMILSKIRLCGFEQTSKIKSLNQPTLKLNPPVFGGFWPSFIEKTPPNLGKPTCNSHELPQRSESQKWESPRLACNPNPISHPCVEAFFVFGWFGKEKAEAAVWGEALHKCWSCFYLKKKLSKNVLSFVWWSL